ncbi:MULTISPECIES: hypothetical protein [unclassified Agromyces]|uniref:hypothetical protein n=1 Tax=unclassified Agromyces TaxID=2639701 RepID=UPI00301446D2
MTAASAAPEDFEPFAVDHILVNDLPASLGTVEAPERYTVTAVFTRRPLQPELDLLGAREVDDRLTEAGYPKVSLRTADRRLLIDNTNLAELRDGLAHLIGQILDQIGASVATTRSTQARDAAELAARAAERAHQVMTEVEQVDFSPDRPSAYR